MIIFLAVIDIKSKVSALLLAAGFSSRMGSNKLLLPLALMTMFEKSLNNLLDSQVREVIVVLGHEAEKIWPLVRGKPVHVVVNPDYALGMSSSLRSGLRYVDNSSSKILVAMADQPFITSKYHNQLITASFNTEKGIIVPVYKGSRGNPVIFSLKYYNELSAIEGDVGGRLLLDRHPEDVLEVEIDSPCILLNLNTPEEYEKIIFGGRLC